MKKLLTIILLTLASCGTYYDGGYYNQDGIYFSNTEDLDSLKTRTIRIRYYPVYIYRNNPFYNYHQPYRYWGDYGYYSGTYTPSHRSNSNRGSVSPRTAPSTPSATPSTSSPSNSGGKSKGGNIQ
jgi:hypothetical protein